MLTGGAKFSTALEICALFNTAARFSNATGIIWG